MNKKFIDQIITIFFLLLTLFPTISNAHEKVVVIPLRSNSSQTAAGVDGQVQFNDQGILSGTELYYRKLTGTFGLGTAYPDSFMRFDVNGFSRFQLGEGQLYITTPGGYPGFVVYNKLRNKRSDISFKNGKIYLNTSPDETLPLATSGVVIGTSGQVGIGTETPQAMLEVKGEVRTTDVDGNSRLWGTGRPHVGVIQKVLFPDYWVALSTTNVPWESASEACPIGSWVCTRVERGIADFSDSIPGTASLDYMDCDNNVLDCSNYSGPPPSCYDAWTVDRSSNNGLQGLITRIHGNQNQINMCNRMKVWCCGERDLGDIL